MSGAATDCLESTLSQMTWCFVPGRPIWKCCRLSSLVQRCLLTIRPRDPRFLLLRGGMTLQRDAKHSPSRHPWCVCCSPLLFLTCSFHPNLKKKKMLFNRRRVSKHIGYCYLFPVCCSLSYSCSLLYTAGSPALSK